MDPTTNAIGKTVAANDRLALPGARVAGEPLDILLPVFHEQENLPHVIEHIEQHIPCDFRVFVIYDDADDPTVPVAEALSRSRPALYVVHNQMGRGVIGALKTGVAMAGLGPVLVMMADLSDDLSIAPRMLELYRAGFDVVCPSRYMPGGSQRGGPPLKRLLSRFAGWAAYWLRGVPSRDITNNFRLYSGAMLKTMTIESNAGFEFALEIIAKAHLRGRPITEIPTRWRGRTAGQSQFRLVRWLPAYLRWYRVLMLGR